MGNSCSCNNKKSNKSKSKVIRTEISDDPSLSRLGSLNSDIKPISVQNKTYDEDSIQDKSFNSQINSSFVSILSRLVENPDGLEFEEGIPDIHTFHNKTIDKV